MREQNEDKIKFIKALEANPVIGAAAAKEGIPRPTVYRWRAEDPKFEKMVREALRAGNRVINDVAEVHIVKKVKEGDFQASKYWLEHHHPNYKKKKDKIVVQAACKAPGVKEIPLDAFNGISISKLSKSLRKQVVRRGISLQAAMDEILQKISEENPEFKKTLAAMDPEKIPWGEVLKKILEEER